MNNESKYRIYLLRLNVEPVFSSREADFSLVGLCLLIRSASNP